jgi:hypothetical protein
LRAGGLSPNPLVSAAGGPPVPLDAILAGHTAVLTARRPDPALTGFCRRHGLVLVRISAPGAGTPAQASADAVPDWIDVRLADDGPAAAALRALTANPALTVIVRPDRVIAAAGIRYRLPCLPWHIPVTAARGYPAAAHPHAHTDLAGPLPATP